MSIGEKIMINKNKKKRIKAEKMAINFSTVIFASALILVTMLRPLFGENVRLWETAKVAVVATIVIALAIDYRYYKKGSKTALPTALDTYKLILLSLVAGCAILNTIPIEPLNEYVADFKGDITLVLALFTFQDALKKYFSK